MRDLGYYYTLSYILGRAQALPWSLPPGCQDVEIPISVAVSRYVVTTEVRDDWDAAALTFNLTRRDFGTSNFPLPVESSMIPPIESTFTIGVTVCGGGGPTLVLTHGIIESKKYWQPTFEGGEIYSLVDAAVLAGYSVLSYDRVGVGSSSRVSALEDAQFQVEAAVLGSLIDYARSDMNATKVALIGHSYGSYISAASASLSKEAIDAMILTGFSGSFSYFGPFLAGAGFRVARTINPARWADLEPGYLTTSDLFTETFVYFAEPYFERSVAEWSHGVGSEPFAVAELPTLLATAIDYETITAPVLILQGEFDVSACGGNCIGLLETTKKLFSGSKLVEVVDDLPAGHNLNLHKVAPQAFQMMFDFLGRQGIKI